jgi:ligand-binding SRPBCC domain-containing protein
VKVYTISRKQFLPVTQEDAWQFFSSPKNLARITPDYMRFHITYVSGAGGMYPGQIIRYRIFVLPFLPVAWTTEITHVNVGNYFVDEQRFGPYSMWHHQHHFSRRENGVEMTDEVNYALPLGILGRIAHALFVKRQLKKIFDYRFSTLEKLFQMELQKP